MPRRLLRLWRLILLAVFLAVPMTTAPATSAQSATAVAAPTTLIWTPCSDDASGWQCSTLAVPIDYANPAGDTIDLAVTRLPAGDTARRIGVLVINCGGPGCPAVSFLH